MKTRINFIGILFLLAMVACENDDSSCTDTIFLGEFTPTEQALSVVPYEENTTLIFSDSLGSRLELTALKPTHIMARWVIPGQCPTNYYQTVDFEFYGGALQVLLANDTSGFQLEVSLLSLLDYNTKKIYDELVVSVNILDVGGHQTLNLPVDQRLLRDPEFEARKTHIGLEESMTFFGKTFHDVYHEKYKDDNFMFKTYYTYEQGIVAFRDDTGRKWVFQEMK